MLLLLCALFFLGVAGWGLYHLIDYAVDHAVHQKKTEEIREAYYAVRQEEGETPAETAVQPTAAQPEMTPEPQKTAKPVRSGMLPLVHFPGNFTAQVRESFEVLRQRYSPDLMGWLKIGTTLDEPVVQKDNVYYLRRDYKGKSNDNGTLFLDESTRWATRPYTLMIYGHNMKSGAMFGHLKSYEKAKYFQDHAIITFDNAYEDGRYVVFAVGNYNLKNSSDAFLNLGILDSRNIAGRDRQIQKLLEGAVLKADVDVQAEDQLLLLITCVDDDNERRILAARRVRENETEEALILQVKNSFAN